MRRTPREEALLILGFYQDQTAVPAVFREISHRTAWRVASVRKTAEGRFAVRNGLFSPFIALLLGGSLGLLFGLRMVSDHSALGFAVFGLLFALFIVYYFDRRVDPKIMARLRPLLVPGDTVLVVLVPTREVGRVLALFRRAEEPTAVFAFHRRALRPELAIKIPKREREEVLERPENHALRLAGELESGLVRRPVRLAPRLRLLRTVHAEIRHRLTGTTMLGQSLTAGGEWFLDNAYLIQGQLVEIERSLREEPLRRVPTIVHGPYTGFLRVYALAAELISSVEARLTRETIVAFLRAYQDSSPLSSAELWAFPLVLRLVLLERLAEAGLRVALRQQEEEEAQFWANRLRAVARREPERLPAVVAELAAAVPAPSEFFALRLVGHLQDETSLALLVQEWLECKLDLGLAEALEEEHARQAADQVEIANAIGSLRMLGRLAWAEIFPSVSLLEKVLSEDPAGVYLRMDDETRAAYRAAVEEIACWAKQDELAVARAAVRLAGEEKDDPRRGHVGYYLIDAGRDLLEKRLAARPPWSRRLRRGLRRRAILFYLGGILVLTLLFAAVPVVLFRRYGVDGTDLIVSAFLALFPAGEMGLGSMNRLVMRLFPPRSLPRMSFTDGIPLDRRTLVVVPMMLSSPEALRAEVERLEVRYLANPDPALYFALLADFVDADAEKTPADDLLLQEAVRVIRELNARYGENRFYFLHRERRFSRSEGCWIGRERKRGKLEELNRLLNGAESELLVDVGEPELLREIRYVLTLDADTQLPPETARRLVETIAHPLNQPHIDEKRRVVVEGYALIQPRVCPGLPSVTASLFSRLFSDATGLDPYCHAVSDVYQDLTGEGTFYGKGLYDPRVFHRLLAGRFPEEKILSHDLLEGAYLRVGFAGDVVLLDLFPRTYGAYANRQHRWFRGDWQIVDWLAPRVPLAGGGREPNPLSAINRWKIFDNLRRSLVAPGSLLLLLWSWFFAAPPFLGSGFVALAYFWPSLPTLIRRLGRGPYIAPARRELWRSLAKSLFLLALLPHQAFLAADAIIRVWYRRLISHRHLLAWETAQAATRRYDSRSGRWRSVGAMTAVSLWAVAVAGGLLLAAPEAFPAAAPFLGLWFLAPLLVWLLDLPLAAGREVRLPEDARAFLREIARATWRYFDDFVGPADHWLPPDNYQEALRRELARRTSPTNIGMWFLAALAAYDLGYLPAAKLIDRTAATAETLRRLEKYAGHLLNWYNTATLEPLRPRYVSTVDGGNLLASVWTFIQGCRALADDPPLAPQAFAGLADTLANLRRSLPARSSRTLAEKIALLARLLKEGENLPPAQKIAGLRQVALAARGLRQTLKRETEPGSEVSYWAAKLAGEAKAWLRTTKVYLPWFFTLVKLEREGERRPGLEEAALAGFLSWRALAAEEPAWVEELRGISCEEPSPARRVRLKRALAGYERAQRAAQEFLSRRERLMALLEELTAQMDLGFLYDRERKLLSIGYDVTERRLDPSYYDLLASEARVAGFMAIARGEVPPKHWAALGRPFGMAHGELVLLSWNGTLFEYLMPALFQSSSPNPSLRTPAGGRWRSSGNTPAGEEFPGGSPKRPSAPWTSTGSTNTEPSVSRASGLNAVSRKIW